MDEGSLQGCWVLAGEAVIGLTLLIRFVAQAKELFMQDLPFAGRD